MRKTNIIRMIFLQHIVASLLEHGIHGYRGHATRTRRRITSLAHRHVSPKFFIRCFEFLHSRSVQVVDLIEIGYLRSDRTVY